MLKEKKSVKRKSNKILGVYIGDEVDGDMNNNFIKQMNEHTHNFQHIKVEKQIHILVHSGITDIQEWIHRCMCSTVPVIKIPVDYPYLYLKWK